MVRGLKHPDRQICCFSFIIYFQAFFKQILQKSFFTYFATIYVWNAEILSLWASSIVSRFFDILLSLIEVRAIITTIISWFFSSHLSIFWLWTDKLLYIVRKFSSDVVLRSSICVVVKFSSSLFWLSINLFWTGFCF